MVEDHQRLAEAVAEGLRREGMAVAETRRVAEERLSAAASTVSTGDYRRAVVGLRAWEKLVFRLERLGGQKHEWGRADQSHQQARQHRVQQHGSSPE